ncbi:hypothetical protein [Inhella proteolytica]|uniref:Uncharacterized protein n=1 Tax=Inhella proteolytica TaxID=2795029 RepID=A0A931J5S6_9BURK|nr:hypothetical protein [Inhella proteolytica]MBH9579278.1 hypothetical protein [Inhella proteolytica]
MRWRLFNWLVAGAVVAVVAIYFLLRPGEAPRLQLEQAPPKLHSPAASSTPSEQTSLRESSRIELPEQRMKPDWFIALAEPNLYPIAEAFRNSRQMGGYAAARAIYMYCMEANFAVQLAQDNSKENPLLGQENSPDFGIRLQARDRIQQKCGALNGVAKDPLADDAYGKSFQDAAITVSAMRDSRSFQSALEEAASQGHLANLAARPLLISRTWDGVYWGEQSEVFDTAVSLAILRATSTPEMASEDVRLMRSCFLFGSCGAEYAIAAVSPRDFDEKTRQQILVLAAEMEAAFRSGDVRPILRERKGR